MVRWASGNIIGGSWHLISASKVERDGMQRADRMAGAKAQRHGEALCVSGTVALPQVQVSELG